MRIELSDLPKLAVLRLGYTCMVGSTSTKTTNVIPYYYNNTLIMRGMYIQVLIIRSTIFNTKN